MELLEPSGKDWYRPCHPPTRYRLCLDWEDPNGCQTLMAQNTITFGELRVCRIVQGGRGSLGSDWMVLLVEMVARCWTWYHAALIWYRSQPAPTIAGTISGTGWCTHSWDGCQGAVRVPTRIKIGLHTLAPSSNVAFLHDNSIKTFN